MFENLSDKFESSLKKLSGQGRISEKNVRDAMDQVRTALLEADVHYQVAEDFVETILEKAIGEKVLSSLKPAEQMIGIVNDQLVHILGGEDEAFEEPSGEDTALRVSPILYVKPGPTIIMMAGLQGSGKTTTCGKLAAYLKKQGKKVMLAAADLQRPAAVQQLATLSKQVQEECEGPGEVQFYGELDKVAEYGKAVGAAVKVCRNALDSAIASGSDVLILDTAGRLHVNDQLMDELKQVNRSVKPHNIFLVIDAMTGQDAVNSAKAFNDQLELDAVILTKFDSDTRGGAALSVKTVTGKPIKFMGTGEKLDALEEFHPSRIASRILGMGDIVSLVERAQEQTSEEEALALHQKMATGKMTMDDFLTQLRRIRKMGSLKNLLGLMPGVGKQIKDLDFDDSQIDRCEAIINSMTAQERKDINLLNNSRRRRISQGSGTAPKDVSQLIKGFGMMSKMGKQMSGMGVRSRMKAITGMKGKDIKALDKATAGAGMGLDLQAPPKFKKRKKRSR